MEEAKRYNSNKIMPDLIPPEVIYYLSAVFTEGGLKYGFRNWESGFKFSVLLNSLERHLLAFKSGEDIDEESGLPHLAHLLCNASMLLSHYHKKVGVDDRIKFKLPNEIGNRLKNSKENHK